MKLHQVRDFIAVAEKGSLRGASRDLGIAQSAITRSIQQLEHELGTALFERRRRGALLTPMGSLFLRRARIAANQLGRAREEIQQYQDGVEGSVTVCLSTVAQISLLPRVLPKFRTRYPRVRLNVVEGAVYKIAEARLKDGAFDFYVGLVENFSPGNLIVEKLFENARVVMGRAGHPLAEAKSLSELVDSDWVVAGEKGEWELAETFKRHGLVSPRISAAGDSTLSLMALIAYSDMLCFVPRQWVAFPPIRALLQKIDVGEHIPAPPIAIMRRAEMPLTPAAEFLSHLITRVAQSKIINTAAIQTAAHHGS